jgi:hypothetical protein
MDGRNVGFPTGSIQGSSTFKSPVVANSKNGAKAPSMTDADITRALRFRDPLYRPSPSPPSDGPTQGSSPGYLVSETGSGTAQTSRKSPTSSEREDLTLSWPPLPRERAAHAWEAALCALPLSSPASSRAGRRHHGTADIQFPHPSRQGLLGCREFSFFRDNSEPFLPIKDSDALIIPAMGEHPAVLVPPLFRDQEAGMAGGALAASMVLVVILWR